MEISLKELKQNPMIVIFSDVLLDELMIVTFCKKHSHPDFPSISLFVRNGIIEYSFIAGDLLQNEKIDDDTIENFKSPFKSFSKEEINATNDILKSLENTNYIKYDLKNYFEFQYDFSNKNILLN